MRGMLLRQWFVVALAVVLFAGFAFSHALQPLADAVPPGALVAAVLFLMAVSLDSNAIWRALRRPGPVLLAVGINFGLLPLSAWQLSTWMRDDLAIGMLIVGSVPCTLTAAAVWTRRAGGNDAVALLVTVTTNLSCFLVTPLWLLATSGERTDLPEGLMTQLGLLVLLPTVAGQLLRLYHPAGQWASRHKIALGTVAQFGILTMVMVGSVSAGLQLATSPGAIGLGGWVGMLVSVVGLHVGMLAAGHLLAAGMGMTREDRIAVGFSGSQKTLMIGLHVALQSSGLAMLPMVAYHVSQLLLDTLVADRLRQAGTPAASHGTD